MEKLWFADPLLANLEKCCKQTLIMAVDSVSVLVESHQSIVIVKDLITIFHKSTHSHRS